MEAKYKLFLLVFLVTQFAACDNNITIPQYSIEYKEVIVQKVNDWNKCIADNKIEGLASIYSERLLLYNRYVTKNQALRLKRKFIKKHSNYSQSITSTIEVQPVNDLYCKAAFTKRYSYNNIDKEITAYLLFCKYDNDWLIVNEGDDNISLNQHIAAITEVENHDNCENLALNILTSSSSYTAITSNLYDKVVANKGLGYGAMLQGNPYSDITYNANGDNVQTLSYDFSIHESYEERNLNIAWYSFNPFNNKLYEYDAFSDEFIPVDFDKNLIAKYHKGCN